MFKGSHKLKTGKKVSSKGGFSLVEVLVAMFVFSLVGVMLAGSFSGFLKSYVSAKKAQKSSESALNAINLMAKTIRSSTLYTTPIINSGSQILMLDNSQGSCVSFRYFNEAIQVAVGTAVASDVTECTEASFTNFSNLTSVDDVTGVGDVTGLVFSGTASDLASATPVIGKVQISMKVQDKASTHLQTTVSLRN
ncbi:MAG: hypothetical protein ACD_8C00144G0007 [uncultured bacterium]|nr:MAG: hypothetical protein ACD_8C00144G0007 [uncultured bacterium]